MNIELPGGFTVAGVSANEAEFLRKRGEFVAAYCEERGWDVNTVSMHELLEIRTMDGWKNPLGTQTDPSKTAK